MSTTTPADDNRALAERFYTAFARGDGAAMSDCYAATCTFDDPVFQNLHDAQVGAMWRMLAARARDFKLTYQVVDATDDKARVRWEADYLFSATGRMVHNVIATEMEIKHGQIVRQRDRFDLHRWASMALGLKGRLLGWAPPVQNAIRKQARRGLEDWMRKEQAKTS